MATLTEYKRDQTSARYAYKDARCRLYRVLYGIQGELKGKRSNVPATDETRHFHSFWTYRDAERVFNEEIDGCKFDQAQRAECERRLELLKRFKPQGVLD